MPDDVPSPQYLRDQSGVVHAVVKGTTGLWKYCHIDVMSDWLMQDGANVVPDTTPVTCVKCLAGEYEE